MFSVKTTVISRYFVFLQNNDEVILGLSRIYDLLKIIYAILWVYKANSLLFM